MNFDYETDRLYIKVLNSDSAPDVLDFLSRNKDIFEPYECEKSPLYYTTQFQSETLHAEFTAYLERRYARFYVFLKHCPDTIIGTVSFSNIRNFPYFDTTIGYKFDKDFQGNGYATEAIDMCISIIFNEFKLHRIEALVMPDNNASLRLVERLGFDHEGTSANLVKMSYGWQTHERYSLLNPVADF